MANKVGPLIKEARTAAKLSQEALAKLIDGVSAADIGKAERGEKELSQSVLRQIATATGATIRTVATLSMKAEIRPENKDIYIVTIMRFLDFPKRRSAIFPGIPLSIK